MQPAIRGRDQKDILNLTLSAKGNPAKQELESIRKWFDMAHGVVVKAFADLITQEMDALWQRTQ